MTIIPTPRRADLAEARVTLPACVTASVFPNAADTLSAFARRIHGLTFADGRGGVTFETDTSLPEEGYTLTITENGVLVRAADETAAQHAAVTLIQLMEPTANGFTLPAGTVEDAPECSWRGVMIDLARDWHDIEVLYEYVDLCRFYKIRYLHLHFTDDQSYTLPSRAFPALSTEGRHYTEAQLRDLIAYAERRGVSLIPEIDVPGHSTSFANGYGDIFGRDGIICLSDESMAGMKVLFTELCELFASSPYIHLGGDEAAIEKWTTCEECLSAMRARGIEPDGMDTHALAQIMYATFIKEICEAILAAGKTPVVWEGFGAEVNHLIPREAVLMSWENFYQTTPSLLEAGFRLVNCSWSPMYIVAPVAHWKPEEVYAWDVYTWHPIHPQSPYLKTGLVVEPTAQIEGGQLLAWGDQIESHYPTVAEGVRAEQALVEERTPALAEKTWTRVARADWPTFESRVEATAKLYAALRANP